MLQRDAFIAEIVQALKEGDDIYFLCADFGAFALDELRRDFPKNFVHCGISEQNMVDVATGLALEGKKVFCYAMAPFLGMRALEQIKCGPGIMNLPICFISVGVGIGYADSGPTHYATEEFSCLRSIIGINVFTCADSVTAKKLAQSIINRPRFSYVRLDRHDLPNVEVDYDCGAYRLIGEATSLKIALVSHGKLLHTCVQLATEAPEKFLVIDLIQSKVFPVDVVKILDKVAGVIAVDEQSPSGAIGSAIFEACSDRNVFPKIVNVTLPEKYLFDNIGREGHLNKYGLSVANIFEQSKRIVA